MSNIKIESKPKIQINRPLSIQGINLTQQTILVHSNVHSILSFMYHHSLQIYLLSTYYMPGVVLGTTDIGLGTFLKYGQNSLIRNIYVPVGETENK